VLVIAGELIHALPIARRLAEDLRLNPASILLAGSSTAGTGVPATRRITGPADARRRARRLHQDDVPHLVVIDAPVSGDSRPSDEPGWVDEMCDAIGASAVWAVVDATRKTADTARHLRGMGEVDAIVVYGAEASADPATPLRLGPPVALIDGRPATAHAWAALLAERLQPAPPAVRRGRRKEGQTWE
jgi:hypothetical protein